MLQGFARARVNSSRSHPYYRWPSKGVVPGAVITAIVADDLNWMIVCFLRKRTFDCSRSGAALGPFTPVFDYIEVFYNRKRRHGYLGNISPAAFEKQTSGLYEMVH